MFSLLQKLKFPRIYYGWWIVLTSGIVAMLGLGFGYYGFSILFKPLSEELGMGRAVTSIAISLQWLIMGFVGPLGGSASDRFGSKWVIFFGVIWMTVTVWLMYFINSVPTFLVIWGIFCVGYSLCVTIPADKAIVSWFATKTGIALSGKFGLTSCAGILVLPVMAWLIQNYGWRLGCVAMGFLIAIISIPLVLFVMKPHRPGMRDDWFFEGKNNAGKETRKPRFEERNFTAKQALRSSTFWLITAVNCVFTLTSSILTVHAVPFLTDRGIHPIEAAGMLAIIITATVPSRLGMGFLVDRLKNEHIKYIMIGGYIIQAIGILIFILFQNQVSIYIWFVLSGLGQGASVGVQFPMIARYWGRTAYGSIDGFRIAFTTPIALLGPVYVGWIYDSTGSYSSIFLQFAVLLVISTAIAFFINPPGFSKENKAV